MSAYESTMEPTFNTNFTTIRIPKGVTVKSFEVYNPKNTAGRLEARQAAASLGVSRKDHDKDRADWRRYRTLQDAELGGFVEIIPEQRTDGTLTGAQIVIIYGELVNIILA